MIKKPKLVNGSRAICFTNRKIINFENISISNR